MTRDEIAQMVIELPAFDRRVLTLRKIFGRTGQEIAEQLHITAQEVEDSLTRSVLTLMRRGAADGRWRDSTDVH